MSVCMLLIYAARELNKEKGRKTNEGKPLPRSRYGRRLVGGGIEEEKQKAKKKNREGNGGNNQQ